MFWKPHSIQLFHACSGNNQNYWPEVLEMTWELRLKATVPKSSPAPRDNSFDCSMNRHEITVLLSYIHAHNHKSTEYDIVSIPYHYKIGAQLCFERNTAFCWLFIQLNNGLNGHWCAWQKWRTMHSSRAWNSSIRK